MSCNSIRAFRTVETIQEIYLSVIVKYNALSSEIRLWVWILIISQMIFLTPKSATLIAFNCNKEAEV